MRRTGSLFSAVTLSFAVALGACVGAATETQRDPSGTYVLISINGKPLPGLVSQTSERTIEMLAASVTVTTNGRFSFSGRTRTTTSAGVAEITQVGTGAWNLHDDVLSLVPDDPTIIAPTALRWDGGATLTASDPTGSVPVVLVFKK